MNAALFLLSFFMEQIFQITFKQGRVLVGVDNKLRIYDLGRVKLLRKCENKQVPNMIVRIKTEGNRIFVGDTTDSIHCLKYRRNENQLAVFADDTTQRWTGDIAVLDHNTIAIGDRLGNVNVLRVSEDISDDIDNDPNCPEGSSKWLWDRGFLGGAPQRLTLVCSFFVGSGITSLQKYVSNFNYLISILREETTNTLNQTERF